MCSRPVVLSGSCASAAAFAGTAGNSAATASAATTARRDSANGSVSIERSVSFTSAPLSARGLRFLFIIRNLRFELKRLALHDSEHERREAIVLPIRVTHDLPDRRLIEMLDTPA